MFQSFYGAQPKVVKNKNKYNESNAVGTPYREGVSQGSDAMGPELDANGMPLNIMYDKRVFRGNTYNLNLLK